MSEFIYPLFGNPAIYVDPQVLNFYASPAVAELGSTVLSVVLNWGLTKTPQSLTLDGSPIGLFTTVMTVDGPFTDDETWVLKMSDEIGNARGKATLKFQNKLYWMNVDVAPIDSASILAMENSFFAAKYNALILEIGSPNGKLPCFAWPKRLAPPRKIILGTPAPTMQAAMTVWNVFTDYTTTTISFTNPSGYTEDYYVVCFNTPRNDSSLMVQFV